VGINSPLHPVPEPRLAGDSTPLRSRPFPRSLPVTLAGSGISLHMPLRAPPQGTWFPVKLPQEGGAVR